MYRYEQCSWNSWIRMARATFGKCTLRFFGTNPIRRNTRFGHGCLKLCQKVSDLPEICVSVARFTAMVAELRIRSIEVRCRIVLL